jgi:hypothetical protein
MRYSSTNEKSQAKADAAQTAALLSRLHVSSRKQLPLSQGDNEDGSMGISEGCGYEPSPEISLDRSAHWKNAFQRNDKAQFASTVLSKQNLAAALLSRETLAADKQIFSHTLTVQP